MTFPATWKPHKLGDLAQYINGKAFKPEDWKPSGLPIIRIQNLTDRGKPFNYFDGEVESRYLITDGDHLISWSATLGSFIWNRGPAVLNQHIFKTLPNTKLVDRDFLHFLMLDTLHEMAKHAHGVGMKHITKRKFEAIEVRIPPLTEQLRIVARINECMKRVDEIQSLRASSLAKHQNLLSSLIEAEVGADCVASGRWPVCAVGDVVTSVRNGRSISQDTKGQADGAVLTLTAVRDVDLDLTCKKPIVLPENVVRPFAVEAGDVFVSRANTMELVGLAAVAKQSAPGRTIYPDLLIKLRPDSTRMLPRFLAYVLRAANARRQIQARALGTSRTMAKISGGRLKEVEVPVPSLREQARIVGRLDVARDLASELLIKLAPRQIDALRSSVLRKAFAGEL